MLTHDASPHERFLSTHPPSPADPPPPAASASPASGPIAGPVESDRHGRALDRMSLLAEAASALGVMPAACAVLRDPTAPEVLRDRACFVVERALRQHSKLSS